MSQEETEQFERVVAAVVDRRLRKMVWAGWSMVFGAFCSSILVAVSWGRIEAQAESRDKVIDKHHGDTELHMPSSVKYREFVSRAEYISLQQRRSEELGDIKTALQGLSNKIDSKL